MISLTIDNKRVTVPDGTTILDAAAKVGSSIPTLCYLKDLYVIGACRICMVEVEGARALVASCVTPAAEGMEVKTTSPRLIEARRDVLELILSDHPMECLTCVRNDNCELQSLAAQLGVRSVRYEHTAPEHAIDASGLGIQRDPNKCIVCGRCVAVCSKVQTVDALSVSKRGIESLVGPAFGLLLSDVECVQCGQCALVCPTGAIYEADDTGKVWRALADPKKHVVVQTAPAVRVQLGEELGLEPGDIVTGQMVAGLRRLGFDKVFDTVFTADLTIIEEGNELLHRVKTGGVLPMITSCSPAWIKFAEHFYPDQLDHLSTCKSPQQMFGAMAKTYYADKMGLKPDDVFVVSIMPCTAKKFEAARPEMRSSGTQDVDVVLTTRELGRMFRQAALDFSRLGLEEFDAPLGIGTGAGEIFGASGGVMEAALRTVAEVVLGKPLDSIEFADVRGLDGVKETTVTLGDLDVRVAVTNGLGNARKVMDQIRAGTSPYHFIEVMSCPGGCIGGGGGPIPTDDERRLKRIAAVYEEDRNMPIRKSHENPAVQALYKDYLEKPLGHRSHELLHTHYTPRGVNS